MARCPGEKAPGCLGQFHDGAEQRTRLDWISSDTGVEGWVPVTGPNVADPWKRLGSSEAVRPQTGIGSEWLTNPHHQFIEMWCKYCNSDLSADAFPIAKVTEGKTYRRLRCVDCKAEMQRIRVEKIKDWVRQYKSGKSCIRCGNTDHRVLEFHHRDPAEKDKGVSELTTYSLAMVQKEVMKCDLLCANCHRIEHYTGA
jgi:hypothetical protein